MIPDHQTSKTSPRKGHRRPRVTLRWILFLGLIFVLILAWPVLLDHAPFSLSGNPASSALGERVAPEPTKFQAGSPTAPTDSVPVQGAELFTQTPLESSTPEPSATSSPVPPSSEVPEEVPPKSELLVLGLIEGGYTHLFAYHPQHLPLTRLTDGPWNDSYPALSPDGSRIAFSSNRTGKWDLYILELTSGEIVRLTDTPEFESAPSWSPDGMWLTYEAYVDENLEIFIRPVRGDQPPIRLSNHPAPDYSPAWSPKGRQIAYVSKQSGESEIWLADLDQFGEARFANLSQSPESSQSHPAWSPDGEALVWVSTQGGIRSLYIWRADQPNNPPRYLGGGDWPVWSPDGRSVLTQSEAPNQTYLTAYSASLSGMVTLPTLSIPGTLDGMSWGRASLPASLPEALAHTADLTPTPPWSPALIVDPDVPAGRRQVVTLEDVQAPYPQLHDLVDESFQALRARVAMEIGWDLLSTLDHAFVPLTSPLPPGMGYDWLYTGRAIAFTTQPANAGWMVFVREDFGAQTYWRVYLRTRFQDGSQGRPLAELPWNPNARYSGNTSAYEDGGALAASSPAGYWYDFTQLALSFGWERLPALPNWRTFYQGARLTEFAFTSGLDWRSAMLELYPPEILITPTAIVPPTRTPTPTPRWFRSPTPTNTATPVPTFTPAWTPAPTQPSP